MLLKTKKLKRYYQRGWLVLQHFYSGTVNEIIIHIKILFIVKRVKILMLYD